MSNRNNKKYRIKRDQIEAWLATANDRTARIVRWLHNYAATQDLSTEEIGKRLRQPNGKPYSGDSVYQALTGRRQEGQLESFLNSVDKLAQLERERESITRAGFVETNLTKKIFSVCDTARNFGKTMFIIGRSHIGKTTALREYARRNNGGSTIYFRAPAGGSKSRSLHILSTILNQPTGSQDVIKEENVIACFDERMVLIVDEAHQFLTGKVGLRTIEFLRELHDRTGCGLVISATEVFEEAMHSDPKTRRLLGQLRMRSLVHAKLPDTPTKSNLDDFARHFGLSPAQGEALDLQKEVIKTDSLGRWLSIIEGASRIASRAKEPLDWPHVLKSHAALLKLETGS
jgi:hypothetical protein